MKNLRLIAQILHVLLLLTVIAGNGLFYWTNLKPAAREVPEYVVIADSLRTINARQQVLKDSLEIYEKQKQTLYARKDSVMRLDSLGWAGLRGSVRARVRADVGSRLRKGV